MSRALSGARLPARAAPQVPQRDGGGVGAEAGLGRVELHPAEAARVADAEVATVGEHEPEAVVTGQGRVGRVPQLGHAGGPVDHQPAAHPEAQAEDRPGRARQGCTSPRGGACLCRRAALSW